jgi:ParB-like nuclease domain
MADCLWCKQEQQSTRRLEPGQPRACPECDHVFQGNGWDGIDAHWRAKHGHQTRYEEFWEGLCERHRKRGKPSRFMLRVETIRLDFQLTECLIEETVREYMEQLRRGDAIQPLSVRFDGTDYFLVDGFHRLEAARRLALTSIEAEVSPGTLAEMEAEYSRYLTRLKKGLARKAGTPV